MALVVAAGLGTTAGATPCAAQSAAARQAVLELRDSLRSVRDTTSLLTLESNTIAVARTDRDDAVVHLRLGYLGLRLAELTGDAGHFRDSEGEFQWATELQPKWPLPWYALATAELLEADRYPSGLRAVFGILGRDLFVQPALDMAKSAKVDSNFTEGLFELGDDALRWHVQSHLTVALAALRGVASAPVGRNPAVLLLRGRLEREVGDIDSAIAAFKAVVEREPRNGTALLELARTRLGAGRMAGVDDWYRGLAVADSATLRKYRSDLALVMSDSALRAFDATPASERVSVARHYWDSRDPDAVDAGPERLREHYRRIEYAHRNYALVPRHERYDSVHDFEPTGSRFDDRGRIYVRHGEPDDRSTLSMIGLPPNESWLYRRPGGDLLFNFAQPDSAQGYRMYESLLDIVGLGVAAQHTGQGDVRGRLDSGKVIATYGAAWTAQAAQEILYSREQMSPIYGRMLSGGPGAAHSLQVAERAEGRHSIEVGLQTDSWKFGYELPLEATVDAVAVGADAGGTQMQISFAIPGFSLYAPPTTGIVMYPIRMRAAVRNSAGETVATVDTLRNFGAARPIPAGDYLLARLPVDVPPGSYTVRVALETRSRGVVTSSQPLHVAPMTGSRLTLSDLALGTRRVPLPWLVAGTDTAWINPLHTFRPDDPLQLFFEVGGIPVGGPYRLELSVLRSGGRAAQMQVGFNEVASHGPDRIRQVVNISRLHPGKYVLEVTVSRSSGEHAVRRQSFTVIK
ncbi:MAG: GWxTD domain-containing protein [Gemmatimonadales bacterium]